MTWKTRLVAAGLATIAAIALIFDRLEDHDLERRDSVAFDFTVGTNLVSGTLWMPDQEPQAAIVLVHGDGPQNRTSDSGYVPLINALLDRGIAVASWDKPGIGASSGNWLDQSMTDRAHETRAAIRTLATIMDDSPVGALGLSQAGWVLPQLTPDDVDFLVLICPAVSWQQQGAYFTRRRLMREGLSQTELEQALLRKAEMSEQVFGQGAQYDADSAPAGMSEDHWGFIQRNHLADAESHLRTLDVPTLAIWGEEDLNVDTFHDAAIYRDSLEGRNPENTIIVLPAATHGLLKAGPYNYQLTSQWPWHAKARFLWEGQHAYAPGALETIANWIIGRDEADDR